MKTRWKVIGLIVSVVVLSAVSLEAQVIPKPPKDFLIPNLKNTNWTSSGTIIKFDPSNPILQIPHFEAYSLGKIMILEQEGHLFGGVIFNEDCPGPIVDLGGRVTGYVSTSGQVSMSLYVGCLCSEDPGGGGWIYLGDTPPTHQFTGQLSRDGKLMNGFMHSLAGKDLPTISITFKKE